MCAGLPLPSCYSTASLWGLCHGLDISPTLTLRKTVLTLLWLWVLWDRNRTLVMGTLVFFVLTELAIVATSVYAIVLVTRMQ